MLIWKPALRHTFGCAEQQSSVTVHALLIKSCDQCVSLPSFGMTTESDDVILLDFVIWWEELIPAHLLLSLQTLLCESQLHQLTDRPPSTAGLSTRLQFTHLSSTVLHVSYIALFVRQHVLAHASVLLSVFTCLSVLVSARFMLAFYQFSCVFL